MTMTTKQQQQQRQKQQHRATMEDLETPLLLRSSSSSSDNDDMNNRQVMTTTTTTISQKQQQYYGYYKVLFFVVGSIVALTSQYLLGNILWTDNVLNQTTYEIVTFAMLWSLYTCIIVFLFMYTIVYIVTKTNTTTTTNFQFTDDRLFLLEAHYVVGSLTSISIAWLITDLMQISNQTSAIMIQAGCVLLTVILYDVLLLRCIVGTNNTSTTTTTASGNNNKAIDSTNMNATNDANDDNDNDDDDMDECTMNSISTFQMIGALLGFMFGACSQFFLASTLWESTTTASTTTNTGEIGSAMDSVMTFLTDHIIAFSLLWSSLTVVWTLMGCALLRCLVSSIHYNHHHQGRNEDADENMIVISRRNHQRLLLRMEAVYVSCSLVGICFGWIIMDVLMNMTKQILPSIGMLFVSLLAFRCILYCFPEEQCLDDVVVVEGNPSHHRNNNYMPSPRKTTKTQQGGGGTAIIQVV